MTDIDIKEPVEQTEEITSVEVIEDDNTVKLSKFEIKVLFNPSLDGVKLNEVSKEDRIKLIKLKIELGRIAKELEDYTKTVIESFKDDEFKKLEEAAQKDNATEEDKKKFEEFQNNINTKINEVCMEEYNKIVDIKDAKISEDTFFNTISQADINTLGGYEYLYNKLVKK